MIPTTTTHVMATSDAEITAPPRVVTPPPELASLREILGLGKAIPVRSAPPLVVGHRGALYQALENTRPSFQLCAEMGCDFVELDVFKVCVVFLGHYACDGGKNSTSITMLRSEFLSE